MGDISKTDCLRLLKETHEMFLDLTLSKGKYTKEELEEKYKYTYTNFNTLFTKLYENPTEETLDGLKRMIKLVNEIQKGKIREFDASGIVGTELAKKYVYPKLENFDPERDLKEVDKKMVEKAIKEKFNKK